MARKKKLTPKIVRKLANDLMSQDLETLKKIAADQKTSIVERTLCKLIAEGINTGDFGKMNAFLDDTIERLAEPENDPKRQKSVASPAQSLAISPANTSIDVNKLDISELKGEIAKSVYFSTMLMADQAMHEYKRVQDLRGTIGDIEDRLLNKTTLARLPSQTLAKVYEAASKNLSNSINYIKAVNGNLTQQLDVVNHIQSLKAEAASKIDGNGANEEALDKIRELIARKLKERSDKMRDEVLESE